jgi:hypothetical protein
MKSEGVPDGSEFAVPVVATAASFSFPLIDILSQSVLIVKFIKGCRGTLVDPRGPFICSPSKVCSNVTDGGSGMGARPI